MVNNQGNKGSCLYGSNNNDISGIGQKQNNQETINGNEIIKDYNQDKKIENQIKIIMMKILNSEII